MVKTWIVLIGLAVMAVGIAGCGSKTTAFSPVAAAGVAKADLPVGPFERDSNDGDLSCPPDEREALDGLDRTLRRISREGDLDLDALKKDHEHLERYLEWLGRARPPHGDSSRALAYYLNAYLGVSLAKAIGRSVEKIANPAELEDLIAKRFTNPKALLALADGTRASVCPPAAVFRAKRLDEQLNFLASRFLHDSGLCRVDHVNRHLLVSPLVLKWRTKFISAYRQSGGSPHGGLYEALLALTDGASRRRLAGAVSYAIEPLKLDRSLRRWTRLEDRKLPTRP